MTKITIFKFTFFIVFLLVSCNDKQFVKKTDSESLASHDSSMTKKEKEYLEKQKKIENRQFNYDKNLKPEEIEKFFPVIIKGYETLPVSKGTMFDDNNELITYAKAQFDAKSSSIIIDIMDYSKNAVIPNAGIYDNPPKDLDMPSEKFVMDDAKGFILWDVKNKFGRLEVLLKNRYVVVVRYNNPGNDKNVLKNIYKLIKINELVKS
jgi:hypothetical protein